MTRNNSGNDVIDVGGAANLTLENLSITGGDNGVDLQDNSNSTGVTVSHCTVYGNDNYGVYIGAGQFRPDRLAIRFTACLTTAHTRTISPTASWAAAATPAFPGPSPSAATSFIDCSNYGIDFYNFGPGPSIIDNEVYACGTGIDLAGNTTGSAERRQSAETRFSTTPRASTPPAM